MDNNPTKFISCEKVDVSHFRYALLNDGYTMYVFGKAELFLGGKAKFKLYITL